MIQLILLAAATASTPPYRLDDDATTGRSPAEIVCALTGDCGGAPGGVRAPRPKEASFDVDGIADRSFEVQYAKVRAARARAAAMAASAR